MMRRWFSALLAPVMAGSVMGQGGKTFLREGDAFRKDGQLEKALEKYGLAIAVDPELVKAFQARSEVNTLLGRKADVASDLRHIADLVPAEAAFGAKAAMAYLEIDSAAAARVLAERALARQAKNMEALQALTRACLGLGDLDCATKASDQAVEMKGTTDTYYLRGLVRTATHDFQAAEADLDRVIEWNHLYEAAYVAQAEVQLALYERYTGPTMRMRTLEKAIERCGTALELNPQSTNALFWRSKAFALQKEYARAIDDISRCMALGRTDKAVYVQRALYYTGFGQYQNAVNDLNRVLLEDPKDVKTLIQRARCKEANLDLNGALKDLEVAQREMRSDRSFEAEDRKGIEEARTRIAQQVFEMDRESDVPRVTVSEPYSKDSVAQVSASLDHLKVSGHVLDKSLLKAITVNGAMAEYDTLGKDPEFFITVPWGPADKEIVVQAVDVYENLSSVLLRVERSEGLPPAIVLTTPVVGEDQVITMDEGRENIFVEGRVTDGSPIRQIAVNGVNASYAPDQLNPEFSIKVDIKDKDRFTVHAEDQYGNSVDRTFTLLRKAPPVVATKPPVTTPVPAGAGASSTPASARVGTTWVIHIENTNYRNFPAIQASGSDAAKMQKAFANYAVARTINKKNLTKEQLDRFFNIELRDLVRSNKVGTILVWYTGHGKSVGGKAYWVPVDARKDDIYTYFNYGSLKAQMQNYSESVDRTVVVSDAAGSDASFYELTR